MPYRPIAVDIGKGEQHAPDFLQVSPKQQDSRRSSITDTGQTLMESGARSSSTSPSKTGRLDADLRRRALPRAGMADVADGRRGGRCSARSITSCASTRAPRPTPRRASPTRPSASTACSTAGWRRPSTSRGEYSIADIALWPWISRYEWQEIDLSAFPNVRRLVPRDRRAPGGAGGLPRAEGDGRDPGGLSGAREPPLSPVARRYRRLLRQRRSLRGREPRFPSL